MDERKAETMLSTLEVIGKIAKALEEKTPLSVVRVGDGENLCLAQYHVWPIRKVLKTRWGTLSRKTKWKGVRLPNVKLREALIQSIKKADIVGIPYEDDKEILAEKSNHLRPLTDACFERYGIRPKAICHTFVNRHMVEYEEFWEMLRGKRIAIISRWGNDFKKWVSKKYNAFDIKFVKTIRIDRFEQISSVLRKMRSVECDLVFISAGVNAVILAQKLAEKQGRIAVDFGKSAVFMVKGIRKVKPWEPSQRKRSSLLLKPAGGAEPQAVQVHAADETERVGRERSPVKVTVIGSGYVGTTTALVLAKLGNQVIGYDVDEGKVAQLNSGRLSFQEPGLDELLQEQLEEGRIFFTSDGEEAVQRSDILMIAVGTPSASDGSADLKYVRSAVETIARHVNGPKIVVTKSTVPIGTNRWMKRLLQEKVDPIRCPVEVVSNPEFLREGEALHDSLHPARTVIGCDNPDAVEAVKRMYGDLETTYFVCNYETAEMIKYASNGFLAAKISFINEMARLAEAVGANIDEVAQGMGMDPRISPHHLRAGLGYGGSCFPKDVDELLYLAGQHHVRLRLLKNAKRVNDSQIRWFIGKMKAAMELKGKTFLVLGAAFKEDTDDQRESPGIKVMEQLLAEGAQEIRLIDPTVEQMEQLRWTRPLPPSLVTKVKVITPDDASQAADGIHAAVLTTPWRRFADLPWREWADRAETPLLFDGRNFLDPLRLRDFGWRYSGVARGEAT